MTKEQIAQAYWTEMQRRAAQEQEIERGREQWVTEQQELIERVKEESRWW